MIRYRRVVYKLSGEYLGDEGCLDPVRAKKVCRSIEYLVDLGVEPCVVVGGGNIWRGPEQYEAYGIDLVDSDIVGMTATAVNAALLRAMLSAGKFVKPTILGNGPCTGLGHPWSTSDARSALDGGQVVLVAGGGGRPLVSTDYPAVAFAKEIGAEAVLMSKNGVEGVFDKDPNLFPDEAEFLPRLSLRDALAQGLKVMDRAAMQTALDHKVRLHVFSAEGEDLPQRIVKGEDHGTVLYP